MRKLNIGCGYRPKRQDEGWINIDYDPRVKPDILRDLSRGLPFDTNSVDEVYASHVMEHLKRQDFFFMMREIWRVCKPNAKVQIIVPYYKELLIAFDIEHEIVLTPRTFKMYQRGLRATSDLWRVHQDCHFNIEESFEDINGERHGEPQLYVTLRVDKVLSE